MVLVPLTVGSLVWWARSGDGGLLRLTATWWGIVLGGLIGSFLLHELGHALVLLRIAGVTRVRLEVSLLRISLVPEGSLTRAESLLTALSGPVVTALVGAGLVASGSGLGWWYVMHLAFLLPPFGDGEALLQVALSLPARRPDPADPDHTGPVPPGASP